MVFENDKKKGERTTEKEVEKGKEKGNNERRSLFVECVKYTHTKQRSRNLDVKEVDPQADGRKRPKKKRKKQRSERR